MTILCADNFAKDTIFIFEIEQLRIKTKHNVAHEGLEAIHALMFTKATGLVARKNEQRAEVHFIVAAS